MENNFYPQIIKDVIANLSKLPGIGYKTAMRLTFFLINSDNTNALNLANSIINLKKNITFCKKCFNFSTGDICEICKNPKRDPFAVCVVENVVDMYRIENTGEFKGHYHILHGALSPIDGVNPQNIKIKELINRVANSDIKELIIATNPTSEGNATASYIIQNIEQKLDKNINISRIGIGIPIGSEIEYVDPLTLSQAFKNRSKIK